MTTPTPNEKKLPHVETRKKLHPDYKDYLIGDDGSVFCVRTNKYPKPRLSKKGYWHVSIRIGVGNHKGKSVHRLVLETFSGKCPPGKQGAHMNGNSRDNRLENLQWVTPKENSAHKKIHGTQFFGESHPEAKLREADVIFILKNHFFSSSGRMSTEKLARMFGTDISTILMVVNGRTWGYLYEKHFIARADKKPTHCKRGHPYSGDNILTYEGKRRCRECRKSIWTRSNERRKNAR